MSVAVAIHRMASSISDDGGAVREIWLDRKAYNQLALEALEGRSLYSVNAAVSRRWSEPIPSLKRLQGTLVYTVDGHEIVIRKVGQ